MTIRAKDLPAGSILVVPSGTPIEVRLPDGRWFRADVGDDLIMELTADARRILDVHVTEKPRGSR